MLEWVFADAKELRGMCNAKHRGLDRMKMELDLLFACMNLKNKTKLITEIYQASEESNLLIDKIITSIEIRYTVY